jgi:hypothetical protein
MPSNRLIELHSENTWLKAKLNAILDAYESLGRKDIDDMNIRLWQPLNNAALDRRQSTKQETGHAE